MARNSGLYSEQENKTDKAKYRHLKMSLQLKLFSYYDMAAQRSLVTKYGNKVNCRRYTPTPTDSRIV